MKHTLTRREALEIFTASLAAASLPQAFAAAPQFPKGAIIRTVLTDMRPEELTGGATLFHEHLSLAPDFMPRWMANYRALNPNARPAAPAAAGSAPTPPPPTPAATEPFFMQDLDVMSSELKSAAQEGVACFVDGGHPDMGRDLNFLISLSKKSGMPIVAGCGYYSQPFYPPEIATMTEDQIVRELVRQAFTQPLGALGEIGTWDVMTPDERKVFRAVGKTHLETKLPIFTHTNFGKGAMEQLDLLESVGVKPDRIVIGHVGGLIDPEVKVQKELCKRGAFIGFDRQGGPGDARQVPMVKALIDAGYAANLMFAADLSSAREIKHNNGPGYAKTVTVFVPKLREAGISEDVLHGILVDNPRRFLAFIPPKPRAA